MAASVTDDYAMEVEELVPAPYGDVVATPDPPLSEHNAIPANPSSSSSPTVQRKPGVIMRILERIPPEALESTARVARLVAEVVRPVPWLGEAVEVVASILVLCQNVGKNRRAASELAEHCYDMLHAINGTLSWSNEDTMEGLRKELNSLLGRINAKMEKWVSMPLCKAFSKQEKIKAAIESFHVEIDQFCKRYMITTQLLMIGWMENHTMQSKADMEESREFFADAKNRMALQDASRCELHDDVREMLRVVQHWLLLSGWGEVKRKGLKGNFAAMCDSSGQLPPDVELHEDFLTPSEFPVRGNGVFDIYRGSCLGYQYECAIKVVRRPAYGEAIKRRFDRQFRLWKDVYAKDEGKHILPLIGAVFRTQAPNPYLCFVSPWMEKGNVLQYVQCHEHVDRIDLIRRIAEGLKVLHTFDPPLLHGFPKSTNILINDFGDPLLADFGLLRIIEQTNFNANSFPDSVNALRWLAPEMTFTEKELTAKADVFMFAMTVLELVTHEKPYAHIERDTVVLTYRSNGGRPLRPSGEKDVISRNRGLSDRLWALLWRCWETEPEARPSITDVLEELENCPSPRI